MKKQKELPPVKEIEIPYEISTTWVWTRFASVFQFIDYRGKTPHKVDAGIRLITAKNIKAGYLNLTPEEFITENTYSQWMTRGFPHKGDLLFTTEAPLGKCCLVDLEEKFGLAQRTISLHPIGQHISKYYLFMILSPQLQELISDKKSGMTA